MRNWEEWHGNEGNKEEMSEIRCIANTCLPRRGRGTANAVDRVDYRQPKAGCAVFHRTKFGLRVLTLRRRRRPATQEQAPILIFWYFLNFL